MCEHKLNELKRFYQHSGESATCCLCCIQKPVVNNFGFKHDYSGGFELALVCLKCDPSMTVGSVWKHSYDLHTINPWVDRILVCKYDNLVVVLGVLYLYVFSFFHIFIHLDPDWNGGVLY